jgi:hypothetical protein
MLANLSDWELSQIHTTIHDAMSSLNKAWHVAFPEDREFAEQIERHIARLDADSDTVFAEIMRRADATT